MSSLIGRAFFIFRQKLDGTNPSEVDIKVSIPAPTYCLQCWKKMEKMVNPKMENTKKFLN